MKPLPADWGQPAGFLHQTLRPAGRASPHNRPGASTGPRPGTSPGRFPMPTRRELANAIRALSMDAVQRAKSGHPGAPMG
ncbi:hypothetical protein, partial [Alkalispirillum mobile]|uniref:hypothetical protein n=1 Tax=Alkalispirillum mobile TaxID=85925 RepID=UPI003CCC8DCC